MEKKVVITSNERKGAVEIASELSVLGMKAITRGEITEKIPEDVDAFIIDNSGGKQTKSVERIVGRYGNCVRVFVIEGGDEGVYEEDKILYISNKMGVKKISGIVDFCLNPRYEIEKMIKRMLFELGIQARFRGHRYIVDAVKIILDEPKKMYNMHKNVYEVIGKKHGYNKLAIERSMRTAIETAYERDTDGRFEKFFGCLDHRPTNTEFLSVFVEKILIKI